VNDLHRVGRRAARADRRLCNLATIDIDLDSMLTVGALEKS